MGYSYKRGTHVRWLTESMFSSNIGKQFEKNVSGDLTETNIGRRFMPILERNRKKVFFLESFQHFILKENKKKKTTVEILIRPQTI